MAGGGLPALTGPPVSDDAGSMFSRFPAQGAPREAPLQERLTAADPAVPTRACCCPARPVVKVSMPPVPGRPYPVDLWLCGHHHRSSLAALDSDGAMVEFLDGQENAFVREPAAAAA